MESIISLILQLQRLRCGYMRFIVEGVVVVDVQVILFEVIELEENVNFSCFGDGLILFLFVFFWLIYFVVFCEGV